MVAIRLPVVFACQGLLLIGAMAGIIVAFVLVTNNSIDLAVSGATENQLKTLELTVQSMLESVEASVHVARQLTVTWGDEAYKFEVDPNYATPQGFQRHIELQMALLQAHPLFAFLYQTYWTNENKMTDIGCSNATGLANESNYYCSFGTHNATDLIIASADPLDFTIDDAYERDPTNDPYIQEIRRLKPRHSVFGYWQRSSMYWDPELGDRVALMSFSLPLEWDSSGLCTLAFTIDVSVLHLAGVLHSLAQQDNLIYLVDVLRQRNTLVATSLPFSVLPPANETSLDSLQLWSATNCPQPRINAMTRQIYSKFPQGAENATENLSFDDEDDNMIHVLHIVRHDTLHLLAVDITPREFYFGQSRKVTAILISVASLVVVACIGLCVGIYFCVTKPITNLSDNMTSISRLELVENASEPTLSELQPMHQAFTKLDVALQCFTKYVPRGVVKELIEANELCKLVMKPRRCSMLFCDIASFTTLCEQVPVETLSTLIQVYFDQMSQLIMSHDGMIDKYIGDCIMAVWGAPLAVDYQELRATLCAMLIRQSCLEDPIQGAFDAAGQQLHVRTGVNAGEVLAGNMGSQERMNYTVIGDPVNLASRLEGLNKQFGTYVMVSESVVPRLFGRIVCRSICRINVVGKFQPVDVYEAMGVALRAPDSLPFDVHAFDDQSSQHTPLHNSLNASIKYHNKKEDVTAVDDGLAMSTSHMYKKQRGIHLDSALQLLHKAKERVPCSAADELFAKLYSQAFDAWVAGDFAKTLNYLYQVREMKPVHSSTEKLEQLCVEYLQEKPEGFNGVIKASEK